MIITCHICDGTDRKMHRRKTLLNLLCCLVILLLAIGTGHGQNGQPKSGGQASLIYKCSFEKSPCLNQARTDQFDWTRHHGKTPSAGTGPSGDHISGNRFYFYIESSSPRKTGDKAQAYTPVLPASTSPLCLSFWYHMSGRDMGTLVVSIRSRNNITELVRISGNQGPNWIKTSSVLPVGVQNVEFTGVVGASYTSDIAIDDILITQGACEMYETILIDCNFDKDSCSGYISQSASDDFDWTRLNGATPSVNTGPKADHTTGTGYYMYIEASSPRRASQEARLIMRSNQDADKKCLRFWYQMMGDHVGRLTIEGLSGSGKHTLFSKSGSQGDIWRQVALMIISETTELHFVGVIGKDYQGDIALDDISLTTGMCDPTKPGGSGKKTTARVTTSTSSTPPPPTSPPLIPTKPPAGSDLMLTGSLVPEHYDLHIAPDIYSSNPQNHSFNGSVNIRVHVKANTNVITLHMLRLTIPPSKLVVKSVLDGKAVPITGMKTEKVKEFLHLHLAHNLTVGKRYNVRLEFSGQLSNNHFGLFYDVHNTKNGTKQYAVASSFEGTYTRLMFPCFDEPKYKATFSVTIMRKSPMVSLSNEALVKTETKENGWLADTFKTTIKMSTYLLNIFVGNYSSIKTRTNTRIPIRIWTPHDMLSSANIYLDIYKKGLETLITYVGHPYQISKLDIVSINHFFTGTENWGLINILSSLISYQVDKTKTSVYQSGVNIHIHELAHQWFGNLVTMRWWSDLWIKEGLATYLQNKIFNLMYPVVDAEGLYLVHPSRGIHSIMVKDSQSDTEPLHVPNVYTSTQIEGMFTLIPYHKGAAFYRMINYLLGDNYFRQALQNSLRLHAFGTVTRKDVIDAFQIEADKAGLGLDLFHLMTPWMIQSGYPVVHVTWTPGNRTLALRQERFITNNKMNSTLPRVKWNIPLSVINNINTSWDGKFTWMTNDRMLLSNLNGQALWYLLNINQSGYYRVNYDQTSWLQLSRQLQVDHRVIPVYNRAQLINDAAVLVEEGTVQFNTLLSLLRYIPREDNYIVLATIDKVMYPIGKKLVLTPLYDDFQDLIRRFIRKSYLEMNQYSGQPHLLDKQLKKSLVTNIACEADLEECISDVSRDFQDWVLNTQSLPFHPDVRSVALCAAIRRGSRSRWHFLSQYLLNNASAEDFNMIVDALGCTRDVGLIYKLLQMSLNPPKNAKYMFKRAVASLTGNRVGYHFGWSWFRQNWRTYVQILGSDNTGQDLTAYANTMSTDVQLREMNCFLGLIPKNETLHGSNNAPASIQRNIDWLQQYYRQLERWFVQSK